ncbi:hypothetical protein TTHERM_001043258 (macronuclear) [Tetrahymena thermophila SB210]|uniref:Uncharacterized protein n=1 Tax=Tetrahymena thermophila (strain SB210) TaxID=312017 RepID=W7XGV8_TETTS|nr:hypothetical protein TTHERM_001043258 [Tetrahymena thermophila SB210]EWS72224.1 hypothetical protein TTHERM_001043258 [Tetrahymena thermophila SB210]|eukprot:XP_012655241.1 hypothetical protein TTHERM_001043258 [Tetrahymena thermophila SB210]
MTHAYTIQIIIINDFFPEQIIGIINNFFKFQEENKPIFQFFIIEVHLNYQVNLTIYLSQVFFIKLFYQIFQYVIKQQINIYQSYEKQKKRKEKKEPLINFSLLKTKAIQFIIAPIKANNISNLLTEFFQIQQICNQIITVLKLQIQFSNLIKNIIENAKYFYQKKVQISLNIKYKFQKIQIVIYLKLLILQQFFQQFYQLKNFIFQQR